jgi:hypothetical protein
MPDALLLAAAVACNMIGLAWLALGMPTHWQQALCERALPRGMARLLRALGVAGLTVSLALCLQVDHASIASLVWVMALAAAALAVAFTLTWWPRALAPLVAWLPAR